ncbi:RnfABCDGE type electron transport complex subunit D [Aquitalea sp. LB_tupeE]|uniref:RnfABCDGE type electron transport complex subunit D n=1 Tax=Aquitalea sp. LB_tupeE TaxID=2748078 RepID=UPI0015B9C467|nr:RnfABCDGE type electron transport complex subunit D [Aquitalea sp. LB_tupeE]NWK76670.1 RnfABCDGE type electron transport complex subunit D [Aquitalea sp. LB_tupeE]
MTSTTMRLAPSLARRQGLTLLALLPGVLVLLMQQGRPALINLLLALYSSLLTDMTCQASRKQPLATSWRQPDCLLTGLMLALMLPMATPAGLLLAACMMAVLWRHLFGGTAHGPFHPVLVSLLMLSPWLASPLPAQNIALSLALLAGGVWLLWRRLNAWQVPAGFCLVLLVSLPLGTGWLLLQPALWLLLGWVMTDGNSTPITPRGRLIHGQAAGLLCVSFAALTHKADITPLLAAILLLMSAAAPLVDQLLQPRQRT